MRQDNYYKLAKKKVKQKKEFWNHFTIWGIMSTFFLVLNMLTTSFHWWIFPTISWGLGVAFHAVNTFGFFKGSDWEERQIKKEMNRLYKNDTTRDDYGELDLDEIPNREKYAQDEFSELRKEWDDKDFV